MTISDQIELRTNWKIYAEEFHQTLLISQKQHSRFPDIHSNQYITENPITAFERKYLMSKHLLWQVNTHIENDLKTDLTANLRAAPDE
ncbi:MAG: hypothetical protein ACJAUP_002566 [Cellvibrionaceae bacterium]